MLRRSLVTGVLGGVLYRDPCGTQRSPLKRIVIIATAAAVLVGAAAAYAAFNNYAGSNVAFKPTGAGTAKSPKIVNMTETLKASAPAGDRAAPLTNIKLKIYAVRPNRNLFPP